MDNSLTRVFDEVNQKNLPKYPISLKNVTVEPPTVVQGERNTRVLLRAVPGRSYINTQELFYKRLDISDILTQASVMSDQPLTPQLLLDLVNSQYALFLTLDELEVFTTPTVAFGDSVTITLQSKSDSFGFIGSADVEFTNGKTPLSGVIGVRVLPTFKHPDDPALNRYSGRMLLWDMDFTSLRPAFVNSGTSQTAADWPTWSAALSMMGVPAFNNGSLTDHPTSSISDANQKFDRVSIQQLVVSNGVIGPLYFHYNVLD